MITKEQDFDISLLWLSQQPIEQEGGVVHMDWSKGKIKVIKIKNDNRFIGSYRRIVVVLKHLNNK